MNVELFQGFMQASHLRKDGNASRLLREFIESFDTTKEKDDWVVSFLDSDDFGHKINRLLYRELVFPVLHCGFVEKDAWSLYYLARTSLNLRDAEDLHELVLNLTSNEYLRLCYEADPAFRNVRETLLGSVIGMLSYAIHEWPDGLCVEEGEIDSALAFGRQIDVEMVNESFFREVEGILQQAVQRK